MSLVHLIKSILLIAKVINLAVFQCEDLYRNYHLDHQSGYNAFGSGSKDPIFDSETMIPTGFVTA